MVRQPMGSLQTIRRRDETTVPNGSTAARQVWYNSSHHVWEWPVENYLGKSPKNS